MNIPIELLGFKGRITRISHRLKDPLWGRGEDTLFVTIYFDDPHPIGIIETFIAIPPKQYSKDEFLAVVKDKGEEDLTLSLKSHAESQRREQDDAKRNAELTELIQNIESQFSETEVIN